MHPYGDGDCMALSSARWPNPALPNNNPFARFTPTLDFTAPPADPCNPATRRPSWGPFGAPNEVVDVPATMQTTSEATNKKWLAINKYDSQIDCENPDPYHVNCGYMRAFVKKSEFFWRYDFGGKRIWPKTYTTNWTSNASISQQSQILEGQWRYENGGVRPLTTGFDRALMLGDTGWINYDVKARSRSTRSTRRPRRAPRSASRSAGRATTPGASRATAIPAAVCACTPAAAPTPTRSSCSSATAQARWTTRRSRARKVAGAGTPYMFRFRQQGLTAGLTRYSCKVWRADQAEPAAWDLHADIPDWPGTTGQRSGSAVLLAHETDSTFGNATVTPRRLTGAPMKIAFVTHQATPCCPPAGSVEIGTAEMARRLAAATTSRSSPSRRERTDDATAAGIRYRFVAQRRRRLRRVARPVWRCGPDKAYFASALNPLSTGSASPGGCGAAATTSCTSRTLAGAAGPAPARART